MPSSAGGSAGYGAGARLLHRLALASPAVLETSFDIERSLSGKAARRIDLGPPLFVCGLARGGTSIVLRLLHSSNAFASLTYRDMPFPLAPNLLAQLWRGARDLAPSARGHGDGLEHDLDTPEAIEEVFWRCFEGARYLKPDGLHAVPPEAEALAAFEDYVRLVCLRHGRSRYLSKNNNNLLRLAALATAFPDALFIHPFRAPAQHAASLLKQHRQACELAAADPFRASYMRWLGHHEFGTDHRPFRFGEPRWTDPADPDHWLEQWIGAYTRLLGSPAAVAARQLFVEHDALCRVPEVQAERIASAAQIAAPLAGVALVRRPALAEVPAFDPGLLAKAESVHAELKARAATAA